MIYETIYNKLYKLVPDLDEREEGTAVHLKSGAFMDLTVEILWREPGFTHLSMTHYYEQNGDLVPDPDMEIKIHHDMNMAEAMTFQDYRSYQQVYPEPGKVYPKLKRQLNAFLNQWLTNLKHQGHQIAA